MSESNAEKNGRKKGTLGRILLVEDHEALATLRRVFLSQQGYEVACARDGQQARRLLERMPFQVVVTDSALPGTSGWEVATLAKQHGLPVILSSGWPVRMRRWQIAALGVDFLCPKPCSLIQLLGLIQKAVHQAARQG